MNYERVGQHRLDPASAERNQPILVGVRGELFPAKFLERSWNPDHYAVLLNGEVHLLPAEDLYEAPACYIEDTAVYIGDVLYDKLTGYPVVLASPSSMLTSALTVKAPVFEHVGYVVLQRVYEPCPSPGLHANLHANPRIFKSPEEAQALYPNDHVVEVRWEDVRYFRPE